jgi:alanine racemase
LEVDLRVIVANLAAVRNRLPAGTEVALVTKADAYGHGLVPVSRAASRAGANWIAVATVQEGIALRDAGVLRPVMVMSPILAVEADQAVFYELDLFVESTKMAMSLSEAATKLGKRVSLHLKVDTGLHRFGCDPKKAAQIATEISRLPNVDLVGIAQHFADSSQDSEYTNFQLASFRTALVGCKEAGLTFRFIQMANSAGAIKYPESRGNLVRIGILGYGIDPFNLMDGEVRPAMSWFARVTSLRLLPEGSKVGYSGTFTTERKALVATLGVGYGDGYGRNLSNKGEVFIQGRRAPVIGLVCMDQMMVDVSEVPGVEIGTVAELLGTHIMAPELARAGGTNSHEVVTRIMTRVPRRYHYPGSNKP